MGENRVGTVGRVLIADCLPAWFGLHDRGEPAELAPREPEAQALAAPMELQASRAALVRYQRLPVVRGDLLQKLGRRDEAAAEFTRAARMAADALKKGLAGGAGADECGERRNVTARRVTAGQGALVDTVVEKMKEAVQYEITRSAAAPRVRSIR
jgi:hypothetical protein